MGLRNVGWIQGRLGPFSRSLQLFLAWFVEDFFLSRGCPPCVTSRTTTENAVCILAVGNPVTAGSLVLFLLPWGEGGILTGKLANYKHMQAQEDVFESKGRERM